MSDQLRAAIRDGQMISAAKRRARASRPVLEGNSLRCEPLPGGHFVCSGTKEDL